MRRSDSHIPELESSLDQAVRQADSDRERDGARARFTPVVAGKTPERRGVSAGVRGVPPAGSPREPDIIVKVGGISAAVNAHGHNQIRFAPHPRARLAQLAGEASFPRAVLSCSPRTPPDARPPVALPDPRVRRVPRPIPACARVVVQSSCQMKC